MTSARRYPLSWPTGWPRTPLSARQRADFGKTTTESYIERHYDGREPETKTRKKKKPLNVSDAAQRLEAELERLGADEGLLSTSQKTRLDGTPRSDLSEPADVGAAVYFRLKGKPLCLACDKWTRVADNVAALAQHIDALRRIERYGVGRLEQAFAGYAALPAMATDWWSILEISPDATLGEVDDAFKRLSRQHHPDAGGSHDQQARLSEARRAAHEALKVRA